MNLEGKIAIVTGGGSGLGQAIAKEFINLGAKVVYGDLNSSSKLDELGAQFKKCDVSKSDEVKELVNFTTSEFGTLDIMVNNAGIGSSASILEETDEAWQKVMSINLSGVFYGTREAAKYMKENNIKGSIVNLSSILGEVGFNNAISYCAAKGGVVQITKASALDLASTGIRVNAIAPGFIKTNMTKDLLENDDFRNLVEGNTPLGHVGEVKDIAKACSFLSSSDSKYVTGEVLFVDGGWRAR